MNDMFLIAPNIPKTSMKLRFEVIGRGNMIEIWQSLSRGTGFIKPSKIGVFSWTTELLNAWSQEEEYVAGEDAVKVALDLSIVPLFAPIEKTWIVVRGWEVLGFLNPDIVKLMLVPLDSWAEGLTLEMMRVSFEKVQMELIENPAFV